MSDIVHRDGILFSSTGFFGDNREHEYNCDCMDGHAYCVLADLSDSARYSIEVEYPKMDELTDGQKDRILEYCGMWDLSHSDINYADVCITFGTVKKP